MSKKNDISQGVETFFNFEYTYAESNTVISVQTDRVLDANVIIPVLIEEAHKEVAVEYFSKDVYMFCLENGIINYEEIMTKKMVCIITKKMVVGMAKFTHLMMNYLQSTLKISIHCLI